MSPVKIGVLISGGGTNLQSLIDNIENGYIDAEISVVISNKKDVYGLTRAKNKGIDNIYIDREKCNSSLEYDREIMKELERRNVELVVLAGYIKILGKEFVERYEKRIINVHPSLIPSFCGKGFYGKKVHQAAIDYGVKITGATVHFVDAGTDTGPIILQEVVKVEKQETVETLQKKVLEVEHKILPKAVKLYCEGKRGEEK